MSRSSLLLLVAAASLAGACSPDVCADIECVMAHLQLTRNGEPLELFALPAASAPVPTLSGAMPVGDFLLLVTPLSAPNWGDPVEMMAQGIVATAAAGGPDSGLAPSFTNQPADLVFADTGSDQPFELDFTDPSGEQPSICFTPYDKAGGRPYPHCIWCSRAERDAIVAGAVNLRAGMNALVDGNMPINFNLAEGRACSNPRRPNGEPANPGLPGCPAGSARCGAGCIPAGTQCCNAFFDDTTSYCDNRAGGGCQVGVRCGGSQNCCGQPDFGSNDCPPHQHHCGLQCTSVDRPCCPFGSSDPQCAQRVVGGAAVGVGVQPPKAPIAGGGGGGGGGDPAKCDYSGNYSGRFAYTYDEGPTSRGAGSLTLSITLAQVSSLLAGINGTNEFYVTRAQVDDASFGAVSSVTPLMGSVAILPCTTTPVDATSFIVLFPSGSNIGTEPTAGAMLRSADGRTFSSNPVSPGKTWIGGTGKGDSNTPGSGPGGHVYNATTFTSWTLTRQ